MDTEFIFRKQKLYRSNAFELGFSYEQFSDISNCFLFNRIHSIRNFYFIKHIFLLSFRLIRALEDRQSTLAVGDCAHTSDDIQFDEHEIVPHFQRVSISGEDTSGVPLEDLEHASSLLIQALEIRERYMSLSMQTFPQTTERFLRTFHNKTMSDLVEFEDKRTTAGELLN